MISDARLMCYELITVSLWRRANARNVNFFTLYGGQFTFSIQLLTLNYLLITVSFVLICFTGTETDKYWDKCIWKWLSFSRPLCRGKALVNKHMRKWSFLISFSSQTTVLWLAHWFCDIASLGNLYPVVCYCLFWMKVETKIVNELDRLVSMDKKGDREYKKLFKEM